MHATDNIGIDGRIGRAFAERPGGRHRVPVRRVPNAGRIQRGIAMLYGEPETSRFLAALQRIKRLQHKRERQTRLAKQRVRAVLRKMREC